MRDSIIFYRSYYEALRDLPRDIQGEIYTAIMEYGLYGNETDNLKPVAKSIFTLIKPNIDANIKRREILKENGGKGGRPKTKEKPKHNQNITKGKAKDNLNMELDMELDKDMDNEEKKKLIKERIQSYIDEIHSHVNVEDFYNYYEATDWKVQGKPMKNWKLTVQTWTKKDRKDRPWLYEQHDDNEEQGELWQS